MIQLETAFYLALGAYAIGIITGMTIVIKSKLEK
jgi:hypothetical protein